ncbi:MAG: DUF1761 domain-containing protein [Minisyncoccia bacterium]
MIPINFVSVLLAAAVGFVVGFLLHGPVSGKLWMRLANIVPTGNEKLSDMYGQMFANFLVNIVSALMLSAVYLFLSTSVYALATPMLNSLVAVFVTWAGFIFVWTSIDVIWMGKSFKLWLFDVLASLVVMVSMGIVIAL